MPFELINDLSIYDDIMVTRTGRQSSKIDTNKVNPDPKVQLITSTILSSGIDEDWMKKGACNDLPVGLMFPESDDEYGIEKAKAVCLGCTVIKACLEDALDKREKFGVRGGMSESDRRSVLRQRKRDANKQAALAEKTKIA